MMSETAVRITQNPVEFHGTYPLPEAQLDRFMMQLKLGYPEASVEADHGGYMGCAAEVPVRSRDPGLRHRTVFCGSS